MIYFIGIGLVFGGTLFNHKCDQKVLFKVSAAVLLILLTFRYGQGTDFFSYWDIYNSARTDYAGFFIESYRHNVEPFYYLMNIFAKANGLGYQFVIAVSSGIIVFFGGLTIAKYSAQRMLSLYILICNYFGYMTNLFRWGIAGTIILYAIVSYVHDKKLIKYIVLVIFAMMFHTSAFFMLVMPAFLKLRIKVTNITNYVVLSTACIGLSFFTFPLAIRIAESINPRYGLYADSLHYFNLLPCGVRFLLCIFMLYYYRKNRKVISEQNESLIRLYLMGSLMFFMLSSAHQAARITDYFTILEVIIFPNMYMSVPEKRNKTILAAWCMLFLVMFVKELVSSEIQGNYITLNPLNYPYVSIWNKEDIWNYRTDITEYFINDHSEK